MMILLCLMCIIRKEKNGGHSDGIESSLSMLNSYRAFLLALYIVGRKKKDSPSQDHFLDSIDFS